MFDNAVSKPPIRRASAVVTSSWPGAVARTRGGGTVMRSSSQGRARHPGVVLDRARVGLELLGLYLLRAAHGLLDLGAEGGDRDDDQPGFTGVEGFAQLLQVVTAHPGHRVTGKRTQRGTARRGRRQQTAPDGSEREQRDDETTCETEPAAEHATSTRGCL